VTARGTDSTVEKDDEDWFGYGKLNVFVI